MGLRDFVSNQLTRYKADTSQARAEVKKLRGEQRKQAKDALDGLEKQNAGIDSSIARWGKLTVGIGAAAAVFGVAKIGFEEFAKSAQLQAAGAGADIDQLREATQGLVEDQRLLEFAGAALNTKFKLTQQEMNTVTQAAITLRRQGNDLTSVFNDLEKSIVEGNSRALFKYGVIVDGTSGKLETQKSVIAELAKQNRDFAGDTAIAGDEVTKAGVDISNAFRDVKILIGQVVVALSPLIRAFTFLTKTIGGAIEKVTGLRAGFVAIASLPVTSTIAAVKGIGAGFDAIFGEDGKKFDPSVFTPDFSKALEARKATDATIDLLRQGIGALSDFDKRVTGSIRGFNERAVAFRKKKKKGAGKGSTRDIDAELDALGAEILAIEEAQRAILFEGIEFAIEASRKEDVAELNRILDGIGESLSDSDRAERDTQSALAFLNDPSLTRQNADAIREITAATVELREEMIRSSPGFAALGIGINAFSGAARTGFQALITGSSSAGDALKQFFGDALAGLATEMFSRALFHGARALGDLAIGNAPGAALNAKTAAVYGAGAAIVGAAARSYGGRVLGQGGSASSASASPATSGLGAGAVQQSATQQLTIVLGNFRDSEDRYRAADQAREASIRAEREFGSANRDVVFG